MSNQVSNPLLQKIPGDYGLPVIGAVRDRYDFFYNQGRDEFFRTRMIKYQSTIFRANMPPGPFIASDPKVIVLLDAVSFPILFDNTKVEKKNILDGTFMPSTSFFGGHRPCAFLDTNEPKHVKLKQLFLSSLASRRERFVPLFQTGLTQLFDKMESQISDSSPAGFNVLSDNMSFEYVFKLLFDANPTETKLGTDGESIITTWLGLQLAPLVTLGLSYLPNFLEDFAIHTFPLPFFPVKSSYKKFYNAVDGLNPVIIADAEKLGIGRDEAVHNLIFLAGFNAFGGMKVCFPSLIKWIGSAGEGLHKQLVDEIRAVVSSSEALTFESLQTLALTKSVVYEALRIEPPVPYQYARARDDLVVQSHDATYEVKKGEMLFGYQPFATKDPKVFDNPEEFVPDRFVGEEGQKLLKYVYWSNGRETEDPSTENKQCPAKSLVVLLSTVMVVEFFRRYDTFTVEIEESAGGSLAASVKIKSVTKAE